jgi:uncharacterized membrane protein
MGENKRMEEKETGRLEAFSDGVLAVAITLLVLNLKLPPNNSPLSDPDVWHLLSGQWSSLLAFVASFATIGIMWINHHRLFNYIKRTNTVLFLLNLLLLLVIVFIPFPTALVAQQAAYPNQHAAAEIYSGTSLILAICYNLLWRYATYHNRLLGKNVDTRAVAAISQQYVFGPLFYLIALGLAFINTPASIICNLLLALFFALPPRLPRQLQQEGEETSNYSHSSSDQ